MKFYLVRNTKVHGEQYYKLTNFIPHKSYEKEAAYPSIYFWIAHSASYEPFTEYLDAPTLNNLLSESKISLDYGDVLDLDTYELIHYDDLPSIDEYSKEGDEGLFKISFYDKRSSENNKFPKIYYNINYSRIVQLLIKGGFFKALKQFNELCGACQRGNCFAYKTRFLEFKAECWNSKKV